MGTIQELHTGWSFKDSADESKGAWLPAAKVPGSIHGDLQYNGQISDPFVDMNELNTRWVAERSWTYKTSFPTPSSDDGSSTELVFKGLDTLATISLNGASILNTDNMFIEYRIDITEKLRTKGSGDNILEIEFSSGLLKGRESVKEHEHEHRFIAHHTEQGRLPIRKAQYQWGWDWGPILVTAGIWRPIYLHTYLSRIDDVWFQACVSDDLRTVSGKLLAQVSKGIAASVRFTLAKDGEVVFEKQSGTDKTGLATCAFSIQNPALWYPAGYGTPVRYELKASIVSDKSVFKAKLIGFRRVKLVQEPDSFGKSFYFRINNIDIFCGGSCWIPADSFLSVTPERYREWMQLLRRGNQIMVRIWGGGIYEDDALFEAADELGILVWQDFCMACQSTPTWPSFRASLEKEARYNVRRLRTHASLIIWAGNNEDYEIQEQYNLDCDYEEKDPESWLRSSFPARYIYEYLLPKVVEEEDPGAIYHPSSPWGDGKKSSDPTVGDIHQWNIWHGALRRYQEAPSLSGRFVSEFGMPAYPHLETIKSVITDPTQHYPGSIMMDYRNRAIDHERKLLTYVAENFRIDYDLARFTHLTQLVQADALTQIYKSWRRQWGTAGERRCGGALVWQLNDCWPTMSWAVVDHYMVPKPGFYAIKRALSQLAVGVSRPFHSWTAGHADPTIAMTDRRYEVWIANADVRDHEVELEVRFISTKTGKDVADKITMKVTVVANGTTEVIQDNVDVTLQELAHEEIVPADNSTWVMNQSSEFRFPARHKKGVSPFSFAEYDPYIIYAKMLSASGDVLSTDIAWPEPLKYLDLGARGVKVEILGEDDKEVKVTAQKPVKGFVFQEVKGGGGLSDNGFDIVPGEEHVVRFERLIGDGKWLRWTFLGAESGEEAL
ncbi:hypothetical protein PV11_07110 [Exophiala sideris]|uniref:Beta-mannosidase B n=1 Tax=Exophiala sideris TaxID=1016849 RepID=A0A0D1YXR3_9EURO|nr:hypothetical protein PV11_07110 [Exophiala sideris]